MCEAFVNAAKAKAAGILHEMVLISFLEVSLGKQHHLCRYFPFYALFGWVPSFVLLFLPVFLACLGPHCGEGTYVRKVSTRIWKVSMRIQFWVETRIRTIEW